MFAAVTIALVLPWQIYVWQWAPSFPDALRGSYGPYLEWVMGGYRDGGVWCDSEQRIGFGHLNGNEAPSS